MNIKSPILYCCYNRLDLIKKSIQIIKNINCKKIYIAVDGPKDIEKDRKNNIEIKNFIKQIYFCFRCGNIVQRKKFRL